MNADTRPLIVHMVFRLDYGGMENGLVNLLNRLPSARYRHCVVALTEATAFQQRIQRDDVAVYSLNKRPGLDLACYLRLFRLFRRLRPAIVHTRNWGTLDCSLVALAAGVRYRVHGEHGWDIYDPDGVRRKYRLGRRVLSRIIHRFVALSRELEEWLVGPCGVSRAKVIRICNGVDTERFRSSTRCDVSDSDIPFPGGAMVVGSITRFQAIKDPLTLVSAMLQAWPRARDRGIDLRLAMIGDGPLRQRALEMLQEAGELDAAWLPGSRDDVPSLLSGFDVFALTSLREGISNTVLEAMATGIPLVVTDTGGNKELIAEGENGFLVPIASPAAVADAILGIATDVDLRARMAAASRARAVEHYSIEKMVDAYDRMYAGLLDARRGDS